jgi:intraflagellar transport protein 56
MLGGGSSSSSSSSSKSKMPELDDFLASGDFQGAMTLLDFQLRTLGGEDGAPPPAASSSSSSSASPPLSRLQLLEWLAYAAFHARDYKRAADVYDEIVDTKLAAEKDGQVGAARPGMGKSAAAAAAASAATEGLSSGMASLCRAACHFFLGRYEESEAAAQAAPPCPLRTRLLFHASHKLGGRDAAVLAAHNALGAEGRAVSAKEDALSKAAMHYLRAHYQEATDMYKKLLLEGGKDDVALHAYIAACYYRLDYYDVSLEILAVYLQARPTSATAINLKACNHFKAYNGKAAEAELKALAGEWGWGRGGGEGGRGRGEMRPIHARSFACDDSSHAWRG